MSLNLSKTPDIVAILSENNPNLFVVGFAAETEQVETHARQKLIRKNWMQLLPTMFLAGYWL